jgi:hypothetical protein
MSKASPPLLQVCPSPSVMVPLSLLLQPTAQFPNARVANVARIARTPAHIATGVVACPLSPALEPRFQLFFCAATAFDAPADIPDVVSLLFPSAGTSRLVFACLHAGLLLCLSGGLAGLAGLAVCRLLISSCPPHPRAAGDGGYACTCSASGTALSRSGSSGDTPCACACPLGCSGLDTACTFHVISPD